MAGAVVLAVAVVLAAARWSPDVPSWPVATIVTARTPAARSHASPRRPAVVATLAALRRPAIVKESPPRPLPATAIGIVLAAARAQLGKPYVYGAAGPNSFDCSGLTQFVWAKAGVMLPHNAAAQWSVTRRVSLEDMRPGDLVFASSLGHVGIYIGGGKMIHAPQTGKRVQISPLHRNTVGAGRVQ